MTTATSRMSTIDVQLPCRNVSKKSRIAFSTKGSAGPATSAGFYPRGPSTSAFQPGFHGEPNPWSRHLKGAVPQADGQAPSLAPRADLGSSGLDLTNEIRVLRRRPVQGFACGVEDLERARAQCVGEMPTVCGGQVPSVHARDLAPKHDKDYSDLESHVRGLVQETLPYR